MEHVGRPSMSAAEKAEVWRRWKQGESVSDIGRALGRLRKSVHRVVAAHGGVPPRAGPRGRARIRNRRETGRKSGGIFGGLLDPPPIVQVPHVGGLHHHCERRAA